MADLQTLKIVFQPEGRTVYVLPETTIIEAAAQAEIILETPCGGKGHCGKCRVKIASGCPKPTEHDTKVFAADELAAGWRLACQTKLQKNAVIEVPQDVRFFGQKILVDGIARKVDLDPSFRKIAVRVPQATLDDQTCDLDRVRQVLKAALPKPVVGLPFIRTLPFVLGTGDQCTLLLKNDELAAVEKDDTTSVCYGVAVDIGTTSVVGTLMDLTAGTEIATASRMNPQVSRGDDVISRLTHITENAGGLSELHGLIVGCINDIIAELCETAEIAGDDIYEVCTVGNTTMNHIFLNVDPRGIGQSPFAAVVREGVNITAAEMGIRINRAGNVYASPNIAGFVGGDTVGVILATGMMHGSGVRLAIDIGTNGELVLAAQDRVVSCSTAAGPAFEGARIRQGMRAAQGAIDKVIFNDSVEVTTIGNAPARGICGTGLIDSVAEMVRTGIVDYTGRILDPAEFDAPDFLKQRIVSRDGSNGFVLVPADKAYGNRAVSLTQRDVREVQLAKGAIRAGIEILLKEMGLSSGDIDEVYLAGAFGNFIRRSMAKRLGLLPGIASEKIKFVGNAAGTGAKMLLAARKFREEAEIISRNVRYVELGGRPDFQEQFMMSMLFDAE